MIVYAATQNRNKLKEMCAILSPLGISVEPHPDYGRLHVDETGDTFEENASIKAAALSALTGSYVVADDSGLSVDALDGAPGVYSARYAGADATDGANNKLLMANMTGKTDRRACFICVIALARGGRVVKTFRGECEGEIAHEPAGDNGFGYDPLFLMPDGRTMAQLMPSEKNSLSHRARALEKLADYMSKAGQD